MVLYQLIIEIIRYFLSLFNLYADSVYLVSSKYLCYLYYAYPKIVLNQ